jgi:hypothetical protein
MSAWRCYTRSQSLPSGTVAPLAAKARSLKSGLIQIVAEIINRLAREGVFRREDAFEYLANTREAWTSADEEAAIATTDPFASGDPGDEEAEDDSDEEEKIEEEPLSQLIERLDATVFGLIEALDADRADLPRLLDEALRGSLWARQIEREDSKTKALHEAILQARANVIWANTSAIERKGHFAMGVGLEAGLAIDAMAEDLAALIDRADLASLSGDEDELVDALAGLAERLLVIRPFIPDKRNALPATWRTLLKQWVSGVDVNILGADNMRIVEDAFTYRLVWALEAIRTRRMSLGWSHEIIAGGAAATLETGVPYFMMAMLIRAGLPSRRAAMIAVRDGSASFVTPAEMREWLGGNAITALQHQGDWPTPELAELWRRFREQVLGGGIRAWSIASWKRLLDLPDGVPRPSPGLYRIETDDPDTTWLSTADYRRIAPFKKSVHDLKPSLFVARVAGGTSVADITRIGQGKANWPSATAS